MHTRTHTTTKCQTTTRKLYIISCQCVCDRRVTNGTDRKRNDVNEWTKTTHKIAGATNEQNIRIFFSQPILLLLLFLLRLRRCCDTNVEFAFTASHVFWNIIIASTVIATHIVEYMDIGYWIYENSSWKKTKNKKNLEPKTKRTTHTHQTNEISICFGTALYRERICIEQ